MRCWPRRTPADELTFAGYRDACLAAAAGLHGQYGVGRDTSVSWELPTWNESLVLVGALARLGARQNPLIPIYRGREVGFITAQSGASLLAVPTVYRDFDFEAMAREIAADRPGLDVLVVDRELPDGDAAGLPRRRRRPGERGRGPHPVALLHLGHHRRPQGGTAHRPAGHGLGAGHGRMPRHPARRRVGPRLPVHPHRRDRLADGRPLHRLHPAHDRVVRPGGHPGVPRPATG